MSRRGLAGLGIALALVLAACNPSASGGANASSPGASSAIVVSTRDSDLGTILVDAHGRTLYLFEKDQNGKSACDDDCAGVWPPLIGGNPQAQSEAEQSTLGTTERDDGSAQVTYNDHPLYYYQPDSGNSTSGQELDQFGAEWYVVGPDGNKVEDEGDES